MQNCGECGGGRDGGGGRRSRDSAIPRGVWHVPVLQEPENERLRVYGSESDEKNDDPRR